MAFFENIEDKDTATQIYTIRCMMNAKPDIVICYTRNNKNYVVALECKFESGEGYYKGLIGRKIVLKQTAVQEKILDFLFEDTNIDKSVKIVKFYARKQQKQGNADIFIDINDIVPDFD